MNIDVRHIRTLAVATSIAFTACGDGGPSLATSPLLDDQADVAALTSADYASTLAELRRATARYHDFDAAVADGFVLLHECEVRPGEAPAGAVYVQPERLTIGIDPSRPQGLLYEEDSSGRMELLGAELAIPFALWSGSEPPEFLGAQFQPEDEFGVWGLHIWLWRHNPDGMFAEGNPRVTCESDE